MGGTRNQMALFGDLLDQGTAPNDPLFMFHHANVDRYVYEWQLANYADAPYYGYPTTGYQNVTRFDDSLGPDFPFEYLFEGQDDSYTIRDVWDGTSFVNSPYIYDSVLNMVYRTAAPTTAPAEEAEYGLNVGSVEAAMIIIFFLIIIGMFVFWFFAQRSDSNKKNEVTSDTEMIRYK